MQQKSENVLDQITGKLEDMLNEEIFRNEVLKGLQIIHKTPKCVFNQCVQFKILHDRLNTQLLGKMIILDSDICLYCNYAADSITHALIYRLSAYGSSLGSNTIWLRSNIHHTVKSSDKENIFGFQEDKEMTFIINILIINTRTIIYMKGPEGKNLRLLKSTYNEMIADEYECDINQQLDLFR